MFSRFAAVAIAALSLAGCEEKLGPEDFAHVGAYQLEIVNGAGLPFVSETTSAYTIRVTDGIITLHDDDTYSNEVHWLFTYSDGTVRDTSDVRSGRYHKFGNQIEFGENPDEGPFSGFLDENTLTIGAADFLAVYRR